MDSILKSIRKMVVGSEEETYFDGDLIIHINTAIGFLNQLGVGKEGFFITGEEETWKDLLGEITYLEMIKSYVYLRVRMIFDPPTNGTTTESFNNTIKELEWRIEVETNRKEDS